MASADPATPPLRHIGIVREDADGRRWLAVPRSGCSGCPSGCGLSRLAPGAPAQFPLPPGCQPPAGAALELSVPPAALLRAALLGYLSPAVGLVLGATLGNGLGGDAAAVAGAGIGLVAGLALTRLGRRRTPFVVAPVRQDVAASPDAGAAAG